MPPIRRPLYKKMLGIKTKQKLPAGIKPAVNEIEAMNRFKENIKKAYKK